MANSLEQILSARKINTVVIPGLALSGVVMSTIYRLFDLDYNIYVIKDNVLDQPVEAYCSILRCLVQQAYT
ncbi:hypothetical protein ETB97_005926 [Aspergillus alliaceus]|uniref:Isochorismatase-like domain-containing protein n=1 Tax=Petromyces alliaceus TaxID=209559 RepID=A0A8H5ZX49_PETAA|nr:hypothetical protein ETB97_005926 [Aspergillus burnettii]